MKMNRNGEITNLMKIKGIENGSNILAGDIKIDVTNSDIECEDVNHTVQAWLQWMTESKRIEKCNPGKDDGLYKVIIESEKW